MIQIPPPVFTFILYHVAKSPCVLKLPPSEVPAQQLCDYGKTTSCLTSLFLKYNGNHVLLVKQGKFLAFAASLVLNESHLVHIVPSHYS